MKKNSYISPKVMVITLKPIHMIAESFDAEIGDGEFDPGMQFGRDNNSEEDNTDNNNNRGNIWDNAW